MVIAFVRAWFEESNNADKTCQVYFEKGVNYNAQASINPKIEMIAPICNSN